VRPPRTAVKSELLSGVRMQRDLDGSGSGGAREAHHCELDV